MKTLVALALASLLCWAVMFLAGTDVWHFAGSPDFWKGQGPPHADLRAFAGAFYAQLFVLIAILGYGSWRALAGRRRSH
jgi:hypothetical protein